MRESVFDGYSRSPKDHDHFRRTKNSCCDLHIRPDMFHWNPRAKFLDNTHNKSELIHLLSSTFWKHHIIVEQYDNDADTSIVRETLAAASDCFVEVSNICIFLHYLLNGAWRAWGSLNRREFTLLECLVCVWTAHHAWLSLSCSLFRSGQKIQTC